MIDVSKGKDWVFTAFSDRDFCGATGEGLWLTGGCYGGGRGRGGVLPCRGVLLHVRLRIRQVRRFQRVHREFPQPDEVPTPLCLHVKVWKTRSRRPRIQ